MPSKDTDITTAKETAAVEGGESSQRAPLDGNDGTGFIDLATFDQILEMDDDEEDREFSRAIVWGFMEQATDTFQKMSNFLKSKDLEGLSSLGHFLKGSSATLGLTKVKDYCEKIQNLGSGIDETGAGTGSIQDPDARLAGIKSALDEMKMEYARVHDYFIKYYNHPNGSPQP